MSEARGAPGVLIGTVLSGRYRLESKLGSGGMSTVYLARDETLERPVAVKVMHAAISDQPDQIERFRREARAVAQLSHPNIVAVIDAGEDAGHPYIVFEYVEGETLKQRIDRLGKLPVDEAAAYAIEIGRGLAAAHARRLVHRDVKPQNVLIDREGRAKVTDFGIALSLESDGLTKTGRVLGTTDYVSPEQAMGHDVDARSDIYSLGILLFEMLTGRVPFEAETLVGVAMKHVNEPMPNIQAQRPEVSSALAAVIERATEKDPKHRYSDMTAMLRDLEGALDVEVSRAGGVSGGEATTVIESVPEKRRLLPGRRVSVAGILLVLAAAGAALLIATLTGGDDKGDRGGSGSAPAGRDRQADLGRRLRSRRRPGGALRRGQAGDRRQPRHRLVDRELLGRRQPRGRRRQARRRADRRHQRAGRRAQHPDHLRQRRLVRRDLRGRVRTARRPRRLGRAAGDDRRRRHRPDRAAAAGLEPVLPDLDHRPRRGRRRLQRRDRQPPAHRRSGGSSPSSRAGRAARTWRVPGRCSQTRGAGAQSGRPRCTRGCPSIMNQ